jgi:hypothetical protein
VITLLDDDRSETHATLDEAIRAAQTWYIGLAGGKLSIASKASQISDEPLR